MKHKRIALVLLALVSLVMPVIETAITGHTEPFGAFAMIEVGLSLLHSWPQLLVHCAFFAPILYLLFRRSMEPYFHGANAGTV